MNLTLRDMEELGFLFNPDFNHDAITFEIERLLEEFQEQEEGCKKECMCWMCKQEAGFE